MVTQQMPNIQPVWIFQSFQTQKLTQLEIMFWPLDVALVDLSVDSDFHLLLISKKDENWKLQLLNHYYHSKEPIKMFPSSLSDWLKYWPFSRQHQFKNPS